MSRMPRLAVGMTQPQMDARPLLWALLAAAREIGPVQPFFASSCLEGFAGTPLGSLRAARHVDSWIMSRPMCRHFFCDGMDDAGLGILLGNASSGGADAIGSDWNTLAEWLDCPRVAVVNVTQLDGCNLPPRPENIDAILLDGPADLAAACRWQTTFEALWRAPVIGWLGELPPLRAIATHLKPGVKPAPELCRALGADLASHLDWAKLQAILHQRPFFPTEEFAPCADSSRLFQPCRIALALDEAFDAYHADSLELLARSGAELVDFSPLRDGNLPEEIDLVYLGGGNLVPWLDRLSANHCMQHALRAFAARGGRIYAEGAAACYLGRDVQTPGEAPLPMTGLVPLKSQRQSEPSSPQPTELVTAHECWLAPRGTRLRGYQSGTWTMQPAGPMLAFCADREHRSALVGRHNVLCNQTSLHLAAHPGLLPRLLEAGHLAPVAAGR